MEHTRPKPAAQSGSPSLSLQRLLLVVCIGAAVASLHPITIHAAGAGADLVVSTFDIDEPAAPGTTLSRSVRVTNLGTDPLTVQVSPRSVELLDDGMTRFGDGEDPAWAGTVSVSMPQMTVPADSWQDLTVRVAIPADMPPDDYILGLLFAPVPSTQAAMQVVNAIGSLIPISVIGDRQRSMALVDHSVPSFVIGDQVTGTVRVKDTGTTLVSPWLEANVVDALMGGQVADIQVRDQNRVGPGASRDLSYTWNAGITAGKFRLPVRVFYNRDNSTTAEIDLEEDLWLIHPYFLIALGVVLLGAFAFGLFLVRRKRGYLWPLIARTGPPDP